MSQFPGVSLSTMNLREAEAWAEQQLHMRNDLRDRARHDALQLVEMATGLPRTARLARPETMLTASSLERLQTLVERRLRAEPIQHMRGTQEFYGRDFVVTPDVLIPRPETEDIVTAVLEAMIDREAPVHIADVGTGSGILAVTLALELPASHVSAFDISPAALAVAQTNARRLGAEDRVRWVESDLMGSAKERDQFDVIVSNPPYIPLGDAAALHAEVREFEPHLALFAGTDGLDIFRRLIPQARNRLRTGGLLLMETGGDVDWLLRALQDGFQNIVVRRDLQGIARIVSCRRN